MGKEIERKFLIKSDEYKINTQYSYLQQGYLSKQKERVVRVRVKDDKGYITIKGKNDGATRVEYEYTIPSSDANEIIENLCQKPVIEKRRYYYNSDDGHLWEIDEFLGDNEGLVVAEIELTDETETFNKPQWVGEEVTGDEKYYNSNLIENPYKNWK
ncbi:MAG: CYTH domain-containing protein [Bacteroidales bacterium]|nr:CYTH domain-containing protein [Bacteroidales bacterium]